MHIYFSVNKLYPLYILEFNENMTCITLLKLTKMNIKLTYSLNIYWKSKNENWY